MAIFLNSDSKVIVQGMTGSEGRKHTHRMLTSGTQIVGGVTPGKGGQVVEFERGGVPVFNSVGKRWPRRARCHRDLRPGQVHLWRGRRGDRSGHPAGGGDHRGRSGQGHGRVLRTPQNSSTRLIGPNCPGLISPGQSNAGIIPADITEAGRIGLVSKSGTLTYQMMYELRDFGFSSAVGIGGDPIIGTTHIDALQAFESDPDTDAIVMIGEIGGDAEERAADYIAASVTKPVVGYVAGFTAPEGKTMGHAGAIVSGSSGTAAAKQEALEAAGQGRQDAQRDRVLDAPDRDEPLASGPEPTFSVDLGGALAGAYGHRVPLRAAEVVITLRVQEGVDHLRPRGNDPDTELGLAERRLPHLRSSRDLGVLGSNAGHFLRLGDGCGEHGSCTSSGRI